MIVQIIALTIPGEPLFSLTALGIGIIYTIVISIIRKQWFPAALYHVGLWIGGMATVILTIALIFKIFWPV